MLYVLLCNSLDTRAHWILGFLLSFYLDLDLGLDSEVFMDMYLYLDLDL